MPATAPKASATARDPKPWEPAISFGIVGVMAFLHLQIGPDAARGNPRPRLDGCALSPIRAGAVAARRGRLRFGWFTEPKHEGWSGRRESNPRIQLGKLSFYH